MIAILTESPYAFFAPLIFGIAYGLVIAEEFIQLRKSKPMMVAAGLLWILVAIIAKQAGNNDIVNKSLAHYLLEYGQLLLFIIVAMTFVSVMEDYNVFQAIRVKLIQKKYSYRQLFWITGILSFFISSIADNLTTAIALASVVVAVGKDHGNSKKFLPLACLNVVIAANAGGVFSPFGDITTLMVWQAQLLPIGSFLHLFWPAVINFLIPAIVMHFFLPKGGPKTENHEEMLLKTGAIYVILLFLLTITLTVIMHHLLHLPPVVGMMFGLGLLQAFAYYSRFNHKVVTFDIFPTLQRIEWDTLLFFYGVILSVGALSTLGYLTELSHYLYSGNATFANTVIGILSAIVDNIPVMFAVITMKPSMSEGQWLLVTLTTGVGGSLLAIGSAAGVALMGQSKGAYTFFSHLRWTWVILIGYFASIAFHLWWNAELF